MFRELAFELWQDSAIVLRLEVNGVAAAALLDTGATMSVIDRRFSGRLNVDVAGSSYSVQTPTGATRARGVQDLQLSHAGRLLCATRAAEYDLSSLDAAHGEAIDILLGRDFFEAFVLVFDFVGRRLRLTQGDLFDDSDLPLALPVARGARAERALEMLVEGGDPLWAILDLGSSAPLMISAAYVAERGLAAEKATSTAATAVLTGISISTTMTLERIEIGGLTFAKVPAEAFADWRSAAFPASIGFPVLSRCSLILDFGGDRVWMMPDDRLRPEPFTKDRSGLGLAFTAEGLLVMHVATGSPAETAGWLKGETIIAVDGHHVDAAFRDSDLARWRQEPSGTVVELQMADGTMRQLTLRDFY